MIDTRVKAKARITVQTLEGKCGWIAAGTTGRVSSEYSTPLTVLWDGRGSPVVHASYTDIVLIH
jgi:hypothetical protein